MAKANGSFQIHVVQRGHLRGPLGRAKLTHAWGDQAFSGDIEGDGPGGPKATHELDYDLG